MSRAIFRATIAAMDGKSEEQKEIEEIRQRIEFLRETDQISVADKIAIAKQALEIIEKSKEEK